MNQHAIEIQRLERRAGAAPDDLELHEELLARRRALRLRPGVIESLTEITRLAPERIADRLQLGRYRELRGVTGAAGHQFDACVARLDDSDRFDHPLVLDFLLAAQCGPDPAETQRRLADLAEAVEAFEPRTPAERRMRAVSLCRVSYARRRRDEFLAAVDALGDRWVNDHIRVRLDAVAGRWAASPGGDPTPAKVFVIGLSRTGTSSLHDALGLCGYRSLHWFNPLTGALPDALDVELFDAFGDINISADFESLAAAYPDARFIWTQRAIDPWLRSIRDHYANGNGIEQPYELRDPGHTAPFGGRMGHIHTSLYAEHRSWTDAFTAYEHRVEAFFAEQPPGRLLRLDVTSGDGWDPLVRFLGVPVPDSPFPHANASPRHDLRHA